MAQSNPLAEDLITCGICHNEIEDPRSLVCLHTYCLECLREWSKRNKNEVICPACRETTPLQKRGVDGLRKNFFVTKLKDRKAVRRQVMTYVKITCTSCDVSGGNEAIERCLECDDFLCQDCHKAHNALRFTKGHTVFTLEELRSDKSSLVQKLTEDRCKDHVEQSLWLYCRSCDSPICRDCAVVDHPSSTHEFVKISDITAGQREGMQCFLQLCKVKKDELDENLETVPQMRRNLESTRNEVNNAIDEKKEQVKLEFMLKLDKQANDLKTTLSKMINEKEKAALTHENELQTLKSRFTVALNVAARVTNDGSDCDVVSVYKQLTTTLHHLGRITPPAIDLGNVKFMECGSVETSCGSIGGIEETRITQSRQETPTVIDVENLEYIQNASSERVPLKHGVPEHLVQKKNRYAKWKMIKRFGDHGDLGKEKLVNPRGIAVDQDGNIAVTDKDESKVKVYGIDSGKLKMSINTIQSLSLFSILCGIKSSPEDILVHQGNYIVNDETQNLTIYDKQGWYVRQFPVRRHKGNEAIKPAGIAINSRGHVLVGYTHFNTLDVYRYTDGKKISSVNIPFYARSIAVSNSTDDRLVIGNDENCAVIDSRGQTIHRLSPFSDLSKTWSAIGVCTIGEGDTEEVFVCSDYCASHRFSLNKGHYLGSIVTDAFVRNPRGILFTSDEKLVVANYGYTTLPDSPRIHAYSPTE